MGCRPSTQSQSISLSPSQDDLMFKIFTYPSNQQAKACVEYFDSQKQKQEEFQLKIQTIQEMEGPENEGWKVIIGIEYPEQSLRSLIIQRKKSKAYFSMQKVFQILELTTEFILKYRDKVCEHSDLFAYLFANKQGMLKTCSPQLLYGFCQKRDCKRSLSKQIVIKQILQMMLMEKVSRVDYWKTLKQVQQIYPHQNSQLYKLLVNLLRPEQTLEKTLDEYLQLKQMAKAVNRINHFDSIKEHFSSQLPNQSKFNEDSTEQFKVNYLQKAIDSQYQHVETPRNINNDYRATNFFTNKRQISKSVIREDIPEESIHLEDSIKISPFKDLSSNQYIRFDRPEEANSQELEQSKKTTQKLINIELHQWNSFKEESSYLYKEKEQESIELLRATVALQQGEYIGYLKQGKKFGKGKLIYKNGMIYDGQWMEDKKNGRGQLYYEQGSICYSGYWKDDMQHGLGTTINNNPREMEGYFDYADFSQVLQLGLWKQYKGTFQKDWIEGQGTLVLSNGERFTAFWKQGMANGRGEFVNLDGQTFKGVWSESMLECELRSKSSKNSITVEQDL